MRHLDVRGAHVPVMTTYRPGAAGRLLSVPKGHTLARPLCRKTSLLSVLRWRVGGRNAGASASAGGMNSRSDCGLVRIRVRGGGGRTRFLLRNVRRRCMKGT